MEKRLFIDELHAHMGETVTVCGWVNVYRDQGKMVFIDLRDMSAKVQCVVLTECKDMEIAKKLRNEWAIEVVGLVKERPQKVKKENDPTAGVELEVLSINVLSESETPMFDVSSDTSGIDESTRLEYRYLDLRSDRMQKNLRLRSKLIQLFREFLFTKRFAEIETPLLSAPTLEGSRDFVVPSRHNPGKFYALPQSPQQYKQLLMAGGLERYFQIARCVRDEDLRADRGFEFTQLDLEMSFVSMEELMETVEGMMIHAVESMGFTVKEKPFPRISYKEAMEKYGADKFDLRTEDDKANNILAYAWVVEFPMFEPTASSDDVNAKGDWTFTHNPFSAPTSEHLDNLMKGENIADIIAQQYDLVCNGFEVGGGSIRAHRPEVLKATYKVMGYSEEEIEESIGHMLKAFTFGAPPHGGIALGIERNCMNLSGEDYLREVQAFPMTRNGRTAVMNAPITLPTERISELGIIITKKNLES